VTPKIGAASSGRPVANEIAAMVHAVIAANAKIEIRLMGLLSDGWGLLANRSEMVDIDSRLGEGL
jgi:hypothetical protein